MRAIRSLVGKVTDLWFVTGKIQWAPPNSMRYSKRSIVAITRTMAITGTNTNRTTIHASHGKDTQLDSHVEQYSTRNWQHTLKSDTNTLSKITDKHGQLTVFFPSFSGVPVPAWHSTLGVYILHYPCNHDANLTNQQEPNCFIVCPIRYWTSTQTYWL